MLWENDASVGPEVSVDQDAAVIVAHTDLQWGADGIEFGAGASLEWLGGNIDGDVDVADYPVVESCLIGPDAGLLDHCGCVDLDSDNDVDLRDFAGFQEAFTASLP